MRITTNSWKLVKRVWNLQFRKHMANDDRGDTDHPDELHPLIRIQKGLEGEEALEILIHELLHACCPYLEEDTIARAAADISNVLWRKKYRIKERGK